MASVYYGCARLDNNGKFPFHISDTRKRLLLTKREKEAQTGYNEFVFRAEESPGFFLTGTDGEEIYLYVSPGSHLDSPYELSRKKPLKNSFLMKKI